MRTAKLCILVLVLLMTLPVVLPRWRPRSPFVRQVATWTMISGLMTALDGLKDDMGRYPSTEEGLRTLYEKPDSAGDRWQGPYLRKRVQSDPWGHDYQYVCPGRHNQDSFDLWSFGPDGKNGTDDDIVSWMMGLDANSMP